jgi:uncharacterized protein YjiS (DUF1127 family)
MGTILSAPSAAQGFDKSYRAWGLDTIFKWWWAAYKRRRAERLAIARLHAMSDRQLRDIGITRSQVEFAVRGDVERDRVVGRAF